MKIYTTTIIHQNMPNEPIYSIALTKIGKRSVLASAAGTGEIKLWEFNNKLCDEKPFFTEIKTLRKLKDSISTLRFSRTGKFLAVSTISGHATVFELETPEELLSFKKLLTIKHPSEVTAVEFLNDLEIVSVDRDGQAYVTSLQSMKIKQKFSEHPQPIIGLKVLNNGESFVTFSEGLLVEIKSETDDKNCKFSISNRIELEKKPVEEMINCRLGCNDKYFALPLQFSNGKHSIDIYRVKPVLFECSILGNVTPTEIVVFSSCEYTNGTDKYVLIALASQDNTFTLWSSIKPKPIVVIKNFTSAPALDLIWEEFFLLVSTYDGEVRLIMFDEADIGKPVKGEINANRFQKERELEFSTKNIKLAQEYLFYTSENKKGEDENARTIDLESTKSVHSAKNFSIPEEDGEKDIEDSKSALFDSNLKDDTLKFHSTPEFEKTLLINNIEYKIVYKNYILGVYRNRQRVPFFQLGISSLCAISYSHYYLVLSDSFYIRVYSIRTGNLLFPFVCARVAFMCLMNDYLLITERSGKIMLLDIKTSKTVVTTILPRFENLVNVLLSNDCNIMAEYASPECENITRLVFVAQQDVWVPFNFTLPGSIENSNDLRFMVDTTIEEIEAKIALYKQFENTEAVFNLTMRMAGICIRKRYIDACMEYKFISVFEWLIKRNEIELIKRILVELNQILNSQDFVDKMATVFLI